MKFVCAGYVILRRFQNEHDGKWQVALVENGKGWYGFPKGRREKGETLEQTAIRELKEETTALHIDTIETKQEWPSFVEKTFKLLGIRYFLGLVTDLEKQEETKNLSITYDNKVEKVMWMTVEDALKLHDNIFLAQRKQILKDSCVFLFLNE